MAERGIGEAEEAYVEAVALCGKLQEPLRSQMLDRITQVADAHSRRNAERRRNKIRVVKRLRARLERKLELALEEHDEEIHRLAEEHADNMNDALHAMWANSDGRKILERSFAMNPHETATQLNYYGSSDIAGQLRLDFAIGRLGYPMADLLQEMWETGAGRLTLLRAFSQNRTATELALERMGAKGLAEELHSMSQEDVAREQDDLQRLEENNMTTPNHGKALRGIFGESDGRSLIERAYAADPQRTTTELNYLGAEDVAGDLRLAAERRAKSDPPEKA